LVCYFFAVLFVTAKSLFSYGLSVSREDSFKFGETQRVIGFQLSMHENFAALSYLALVILLLATLCVSNVPSKNRTQQTVNINQTESSSGAPPLTSIKTEPRTEPTLTTSTKETCPIAAGVNTYYFDQEI
tara:strand:- start:1090 stop:1479 length:390 start_codon:yes stop_codon:yes gene_type:complete